MLQTKLSIAGYSLSHCNLFCTSSTHDEIRSTATTPRIKDIFAQEFNSDEIRSTAKTPSIKVIFGPLQNTDYCLLVLTDETLQCTFLSLISKSTEIEVRSDNATERHKPISYVI